MAPIKFYVLTYPNYETDYELNKNNPVRKINEFYFPGVDCNYCGDVWASSERLRYNQEASFMIESLIRECKFDGPIPLAEWENLRDRISQKTGLTSSEIAPGMEISWPEMELLRNVQHDFIHVFPGQVLVSTRVKDFFEKENITGVGFIKVKLIKSKKIKDTLFEFPEYWELNVKGKAWRKGILETDLIVCTKCNRTIYPELNNPEVDLLRWDGSDIFNIDKNTNVIIISDKVFRLIDNNNFSNVNCVDYN